MAPELTRIESALGSPIRVRRSSGSRMRLVAHLGEIELVLPRRASLLDAALFAESQIAWMRQRMQEQRAQCRSGGEDFSIQLSEHDVIVLFGQRFQLRYDPQALLVQADDDASVPTLRVGVDTNKTSAAKVRKLLANYAKDRLNALAMQEVKRVAELFGTRMRTLSIRSMTSRWGSLAADNAMSLNFALAFAPLRCIQYVVCHEMAHTLERNHSRRFWAHVARAQPDYKVHHAWMQNQYSYLMHMTDQLLSP